jgi:signal transduction histidine kinase
MKISRSQDNYGIQVSRNQEEKFPDADSYYYQAIENADGVPYHLIFLSQTSEEYYLKAGAGIEELLGIPPEDFTEKLFRSMIEEVVPLSKDAPADLAESRRRLLSREIRNCKLEILLRTEDGKRKWIRDSSLPLIDDETEQVIGVFGILQDISSIRLKPDNLNKISEKEDECDNLKVAFLHNISHEIRTPLNAIIGFSTLLGEHLDDPVRRLEDMDIITRNADNLLKVIDDIVEMSKIEAKTVRISKDSVNLYSLLRRVYDQNRDDACRKGLIFKFATAPDAKETEIFTDSYKLAQVLSNLVGNSIKFTKEGQVQFGYSLNEKKIEFFVSDTGIGIPEEHQANIFSRFYQADCSSRRSYGGTGLGLAIAKAYVELLGGDIWFTSNASEGTVFSFTLPDERKNGDAYS